MASPLPALRSGHTLHLLHGATEFFPALIEAIDAAEEEVRLETYIFDFQGGGSNVAHALERAAQRGVDVKVVVDGYGTPPLTPEWAARFAKAGVGWRVYSPVNWTGVFKLGSWRRLHRKLCLVDHRVAFCGGINVLDDLFDQVGPTGLAPRLDFSVRVTGPLTRQVDTVMRHLWLHMEAMRDARIARIKGALRAIRASRRTPRTPPEPAPPDGHGAKAALVLRDNFGNRNHIERAYHLAIAMAREEIVIANAYFIPGRKMRRLLVRAARRGVKVKLLLQGRYESFLQFYAARAVYGSLLRAGVEIHEYSPSFLHAKVAVIDGLWATVGSSNLDPLSLLLAREANVIVEDFAFADALRADLMDAIAHEGQVLDRQSYLNRPMTQRLFEEIALLATRLAVLVQGKSYL